jgi:hypothetical protein
MSIRSRRPASCPSRRQLASWPRPEAATVRRAVFRRVQHGVDLASSERLASRVRSLGDVPLAVVTAAEHDGEWGHRVSRRLARALDRQWAARQDELAALSSDHIHVVALRSDHLIQRRDGQPDVVNGAVRAVVRAARDDTHPSAMPAPVPRSRRSLCRRLVCEPWGSIGAGEERMLDRVVAELPKLARAVVRSEVGGKPSHDLAQAGAADAVRETLVRGRRRGSCRWR